jgi:UDP-GlcNAc:undecaprenyl-phosphate GlcNAc-1-phosphate transferase
MLNTLAVSAALTFAVGLLTHKLGIALAYRFRLLDVPSLRRRHSKPTPINGGLCIFAAFIAGVALFSKLQPAWFAENIKSLEVYGVSLSILLTLGLIDDTRGLKPWPKLVFQTLATVILVAFEPHVHSTCLLWQETLGPIVWPMALVWIAGITNAINLVDGLDGLAGGVSFLVSLSILGLSIYGGQQTAFPLVMVGVLSAGTLAFLFYNWNPAKIFLGDNGSLSLGFVIASCSLTCKPGNHSWIMVSSVILMLGYPMLDMGLAVMRRARSGLPLFKADRNHLHFRVRRLGLSTRQTAVILLSISFYLQVTALCINFLPTAASALGIGIVIFSIFNFLFLMKCVEQEKIRRIVTSKPLLVPVGHATLERWVLNIELSPLYEVALLEERVRYPDLVMSLESMLRTITSHDDEIFRDDQRISIVLSRPSTRTAREVRDRYAEKIKGFCSLVDLQCSLSSLPISFERAEGRAAAVRNAVGF